MRVFVLVLVLAGVFAFDGTFGPDAADWMHKIRQDIMARGNFSKRVPPKSNRSATSDVRYGGYYSDAGTDVHMQIRFFKVQNVDAANGKMTLKVWHRLRWSDTRLAWNPKDYGMVAKVWFSADNTAGAEDNEVRAACWGCLFSCPIVCHLHYGEPT